MRNRKREDKKKENKKKENKKGIYRLVKYDIKAGFFDNRIKFAAFTLLCVFICVMGVRSITSIEKQQGVSATILDYICYMVGGPKHIPQGQLELYVIPVLWLAIQAMIAYMVGYYAVTDLHMYGQQILIRSNSRRKWWFSKCIWNILTVSAIYIIIYGSIMIAASAAGAKPDFKLTQKIVTSVCNIDMAGGNRCEITLILFIMPVLVSITLSMVQMTAALITSPIIGFIATQSIVFLSTIYENRLLISNYAMLSHNKITCMSKIEYKEGIIICLAVFLVSVTVGIKYFDRCSILPKNQEV